MQQTNTVNKIKFTLDNLNYDILAVDKDIQFVLPQSLPTKEELKDKLSPTVDITIKVYVKTLDKTPKITFIGENDNINVITYGSLSLLPHSIMSIALSTTDGGKNWMVVSCSTAESSAEAAKQAAEKAQKTADTALTNSEDAQSNIETVQQNLDDYEKEINNSIVDIRNDITTNTQSITDISTDIATNIKPNLENVTNVANSASTNANTAIDSLNTFKQEDFNELNNLVDSIEENKLNKTALKAFVVELTEKVDNPKQYTTSTTYEEVNAAYNSGLSLYIKVSLNSVVEYLPLMGMQQDSSGVGYYFGYTQTNIAGEVSTAIIHYLHKDNEDIWENTSVTSSYFKLEEGNQGPVASGNLNMGEYAITNVQKLQINGLLLGSTIESGVNAARLTGTIEGDAPAEAAFVKASSNDNIPVSVGTPTKAQHATTKEYVDGKITGIFNYDSSTETLTIITN